MEQSNPECPKLFATFLEKLPSVKALCVAHDTGFGQPFYSSYYQTDVWLTHRPSLSLPTDFRLPLCAFKQCNPLTNSQPWQIVERLKLVRAYQWYEDPFA